MAPKPGALMRDIAELAKNDEGIALVEIKQSMERILVSVPGPVSTPYESGTFLVRIHIPEEFPLKCPSFYFETNVFHPNVSPNDGKICVDRLAESWSPSITLKGSCRIISMLLSEPNPNSPLNTDAARMMEDDEEMYNRTVLVWTKHFANGIHSFPPYDDMIERLCELNVSPRRAVGLLTNSRWEVEEAAEVLMQD
ncbi:SUMO-conjugating enzyme UBC9-like [Thrips palmi]|uniref:SUMO-conjugating enzyme UBC9-like n=1 Tax=Thrips palmi TaxID=161013 RepID=A0A6P8ZUY3_THRPL|nr:SUMO-conjugating enzyme UBC9-like [Thrips palmi]